MTPDEGFRRQATLEEELAWIRECCRLLKQMMPAIDKPASIAKSEAFWDLQLKLALRLQKLSCLQGNPDYGVDLYEIPNSLRPPTS